MRFARAVRHLACTTRERGKQGGREVESVAIAYTHDLYSLFAERVAMLRFALGIIARMVSESVLLVTAGGDKCPAFWRHHSLQVGSCAHLGHSRQSKLIIEAEEVGICNCTHWS